MENTDKYFRCTCQYYFIMTAHVKEVHDMNEKYPLNLLIDIVDDDREWIIQKVVARLHALGLDRVRIFHDPVQYREQLKTEPNLLPHLAIFDLNLDSAEMNGIDLTIMVTKRTRRRRVKAKVIMISGSRNDRVKEAFTNADGWRWLDKDREDFDTALTDFISDAVEEFWWAMGEKKHIDDLINDLPDLEIDEVAKQTDDGEKTI